jgi:signal transduction histidine kinase
MRHPTLPVAALYVAVYIALDWLSYIQPVGPLPITPWNPQPGLSLAFLLHFGARQGFWLLVAGVAAEVVVRGLHASPAVLLASAAIPATVYTTLAWVLRGPVNVDFARPSLRQIAAFVGAVLVACAAVAAALITLYAGSGLLAAGRWVALAQSWIGDSIGIVVTTPAIMLFAARDRALPTLSWRWLAQLLAIAAAFWVVFFAGLHDEPRLFYVLFLPLVWIAMDHGLPGTAAAVLIIQLGLVAVLGYRAGPLLDYQFLMLALAVTGLLIGAAVSERRRIERELRDKQFELDRSLRLAAASELASAMAHELQQPLTAVGNYVRACALMARRSDVPRDELERTVQKAVDESERAGRVVRRMRDFFRTGALAPGTLDAQALALAAIAGVRDRAERHGIAVTLQASAEPLAPIRVDEAQIQAVLQNLLANAIDAVKSGASSPAIVVRVERADDAMARISVEDNGPGVTPDIAGRLFTHFATSKVDGMGLGLAISRSIVEGHGGRIWHEPLEPGAAFRFTVPFQ